MFAVKKLVKEPRPRVPFLKIKDKILGKPYDLSLVLCGDALTQKLNKRYRKKNKPTNVLSFPLSKNEGEIFLNLPLIKKESKKLKIKISSHTVFLFIHGLLHLKGYSHGSTMKREEEKFLRIFKVRL